jgi:hypothetical protein
MGCVEKKFELQGRKWEEYKGTRYSDGDRALVVELWLHRVADDLSGLTFQEWLAEVRPLQLDTVDLGHRRTRDAGVRNLQGVGNSTFVLSVENDNDFRSRCE